MQDLTITKNRRESVNKMSDQKVQFMEVFYIFNLSNISSSTEKSIKLSNTFEIKDYPKLTSISKAGNYTDTS